MGNGRSYGRTDTPSFKDAWPHQKMVPWVTLHGLSLVNCPPYLPVIKSRLFHFVETRISSVFFPLDGFIEFWKVLLGCIMESIGLVISENIEKSMTTICKLG